MIRLVMATVLGVLFIIQMKAGGKYDSMVENLDQNEYPLKSFYCVGFAWNNTKFLKIPAGVYRKLINQARILYDSKYAQYYVLVRWAQIVSMTHLFLLCSLIISSVFDSTFFAVVGIGITVFTAYSLFINMDEKIKKREAECNVELPEVVSSMALLINSGMVLKEAWSTVAYSKQGEIYTLMQSACIDMQNGMSEADAIYKFGILSGSTEIKKFTSNIVQGLEKGSNELSHILTMQSSEMWNIKRQYMLQKGEAAASKLLAPIACIFVGIIIMVIAGAIGMLAS